MSVSASTYNKEVNTSELRTQKTNHITKSYNVYINTCPMKKGEENPFTLLKKDRTFEVRPETTYPGFEVKKNYFTYGTFGIVTNIIL